jgi:NAD-dependent DNA ligase (contains BRCT domain type II)
LGQRKHRAFSGKNATKAINAIARARTSPLSRWLFALAIPDVGKTTATQVARFYDTIQEISSSQLLRHVVDYHEKRGDKKSAKEIAERLIKSGFAKPSKSKAGKDGIVTEVGPVVAQSVLHFFASPTGKKILRRLKELGIEPKSEKVSATKQLNCRWLEKRLSSPARCPQ